MAMATGTEASRSTNPSPESYVGSLISLISKAEIRYEGILFNINTQESSIGLRNVRSFGSEGRKKDGPQLPPSDKVYEYILFRGSDIKDLHVKSSPPVQTAASIYNDPAIIQSHIPQEIAMSASLPSLDTRSQQNSDTSQLGLPKSAPQSSAPIYQPGGNLGSWGSSYPSPVTNGVWPTPMYVGGIHGASDGHQTQHPPLLQSAPGLLTRPSIQQTMPNSALNASLYNIPSNVSPPPLIDTPPPLWPSFSPIATNVNSPLLPSQSSAFPSNLATVLEPNKGPMQGNFSANMSTISLQLATLPTTILDDGALFTARAVQPTSAEPTMSTNYVLESEQHVAGASGSFLNRGLTPPLVTPNQFLQSRTVEVSSSQSSLSIQKDVEIAQVSSAKQPPLQTLPESQAPILPTPTPVDYKIRGDTLHSRHSSRGGRGGRGRGHWTSNNVTNFTEEFDFVSMNEKFNKNEVWGELGKQNSTQEDGYLQDNDNVGKTTSETKPGYVKDEFFDSLSSSTSGGSHRGRSIFSGEKKLNTETFGDSARYRVGHGYGRSGRGFDHHGRGFDHRGRGYVYNRGGRGFTHGGQSRDGRNSGRSYGYNERGGWGHHAT